MPPPVKPCLLFARQTIEQRNEIATQYLHAVKDWTRLMIDSGAYMEFTTGKEPMPIHAFAKWTRELLRELGPDAEVEYMTLDVIGDPVRTRANYEALLDAGLRPIPILTRGAPDQDIARYLETSEKVGIGGVVGNAPALMAMVRRLPHGTPQHWLGFSTHDFLIALKPTSVDASSFTVGRVYSDHRYYAGGLRRPKTVKSHLSAPDRRDLRRHGFAPELIRDRNSRGVMARDTLANCVTVDSYVRYSRDIEERLGTRYYFATGLPNWPLLFTLAQRLKDASCCWKQYRTMEQVRPMLASGLRFPLDVTVPCRHR